MLACRAKEDKEVPYKMKKTKKDVNRNEKKKSGNKRRERHDFWTKKGKRVVEDRKWRQGWMCFFIYFVWDIDDQIKIKGFKY